MGSVLSAVGASTIAQGSVSGATQRVESKDWEVRPKASEACKTLSEKVQAVISVGEGEEVNTAIFIDPSKAGSGIAICRGDALNREFLAGGGCTFKKGWSTAFSIAKRALIDTLSTLDPEEVELLRGCPFVIETWSYGRNARTVTALSRAHQVWTSVGDDMGFKVLQVKVTSWQKFLGATKIKNTKDDPKKKKKFVRKIVMDQYELMFEPDLDLSDALGMSLAYFGGVSAGEVI
jgi:hypothetical protein